MISSRSPRHLKGQNLRTLDQRKEFTLTVDGDLIVYTNSKGNDRPHGGKYLQRVCDEFSNSNSLKNIKYRKLTNNASYTLAVIAKYLGAIVDGKEKPTRRPK